MICPHCQRTIDDASSLCPHCHGYVRDPASPSPSEFVFCDGCGARLSPHDRTCPKCGRPAPGILSTDSSAPDLAAGKTASFPRLTKRMIEAEARELGRDEPAPAPDPFSTNVLPASELADAAAGGSAGEDPYHGPRRRPLRPLVIGGLALALVAGGAYFAVADPLGVMPGYLSRLRDSASEMFPSRMAPEAGEAAGSAGAAAEPEGPEAGAPTDAQALTALTAAYKRIVAQHDALKTIIDDYNTVIFASNRDQRAEGAASAYGARDILDDTVEDLEALRLPEGSAYAGDLANLLELAGWVRTRVDMYCASWDIALSFTGSDLPSNHQDEILAPLRERAAADAEARDNFFSHVAAFEPKPVSGA